MHISLAPQLLPNNIFLNQILTETFTENNSPIASEISSPSSTSLWENYPLMGHSQMECPWAGAGPRLRKEHPHSSPDIVLKLSTQRCFTDHSAFPYFPVLPQREVLQRIRNVNPIFVSESKVYLCVLGTSSRLALPALSIFQPSGSRELGSHPSRVAYKAHKPFQNHLFTN